VAALAAREPCTSFGDGIIPDIPDSMWFARYTSCSEGSERAIRGPSSAAKARSPLHDLGQSWMHTSVLCELRDREIDDDDVGPPLLHSLLSVVDETDSDGAYSEALSDGTGGCELVSERELL